MATSKILVIDDSRVIRKTVRDMLPEGDFEVIEAKDGLEGIEFVQKEHPALIMLDFILPKMSGWDVFQQIQAHPEYQKIPLVLMSGKKEEVTSKISEPFEYFEFIEKPFDRVVLSEAIRVAMTKARKARPRMAELPGTVAAQCVDRQVSNDEVAQLQADLGRALERITAIETNAFTQIEQLQDRLSAAEQSHQTQLHELTARLGSLQHDNDVDRQDSIEKVIKLETEVDTLKKQLGQLIVLIKKRLT
ncbi:response regulator [Chamaesiphon sp. OTE_8_metabat_110]|uniref:response regulator n=1 Tax=Chamaesiphon sp. OTE_8_metabat_110 TaxID=2964696 RepID=UPI0037BFC485